jgi:hypothetical protein
MNYRALLFSATVAFLLSSKAHADAFSIANTCGSLVGKAAACGISTETLSRRCGQKIDEQTSGAPQERSRAIKQFMLSAEMSAKYQKAGGNESCSSIRSAVNDATR